MLPYPACDLWTCDPFTSLERTSERPAGFPAGPAVTLPRLNEGERLAAMVAVTSECDTRGSDLHRRITLAVIEARAGAAAFPSGLPAACACASATGFDSGAIRQHCPDT